MVLILLHLFSSRFVLQWPAPSVTSPAVSTASFVVPSASSLACVYRSTHIKKRRSTSLRAARTILIYLLCYLSSRHATGYRVSKIHVALRRSHAFLGAATLEV